MTVSARYIIHNAAPMQNGWILKRVLSVAWADRVNIMLRLNSIGGGPDTGGLFTLDAQKIQSPLSDRSQDTCWTNITSSGSSTQISFGSSATAPLTRNISLTSSDWGGAMPDLGLRLQSSIALAGGTSPTFNMDLVVMAWKD